VKQYLSALGLFVVITVASVSMAAESKGVTKGSFRDLHPNAVVKDYSVSHNAAFTGINHEPYHIEIQNEFKRVMRAFEEYGYNFCNGKSKYFIAEHVSLVPHIHPNGALFFTSDANVICFDMPAATPTDTAPAKPMKKKTQLSLRDSQERD
jgi:hypothetical protein